MTTVIPIFVLKTWEGTSWLQEKSTFLDIFTLFSKFETEGS